VTMPAGLSRTVSFLKNDDAEKYPVFQLMFFVTVISFLEGADNTLFPSVTKALERTIDFDVTILGLLSTVQLIFQSFFGPFWGVVASRGYMERRSILAVCTVAQGVATAVMWAFVKNNPVLMALRAVNGAALAGLRPIAASIVADRFDDESRGRYFGFIYMALSGGGSIVGVPVVQFSEYCFFSSTPRYDSCPLPSDECNSTIINGTGTPEPPEPCLCDGGLIGWEMAFIIVGMITIVFGPTIYLFLKAPPVHVNHAARAGGAKQELETLCKLLRTPTFAILVFQGGFGVIPWRAFEFKTFFFETAGLNKSEVASVNFIGGFGGIFGSPLGGFIGDKLSSLWPLHGRVLCAELSVYGGIPIAYFTFYHGLPDEAFAYMYYLLLTIGLGLVATWAGPGTNNPILSTLVEPEERALIISWQISLEGAFSSIGPVLFTALLPLLGYYPECNHPCIRPDYCKSVEENILAAGFALFLTTCVPWTACGGLYSCLHCTYPSDAEKIERAREQQRNDIATELVAA